MTVIRKIVYAFSLSILFVCPLAVSAEVTITEIMYDLEGSDTGREWIEVMNGGSVDIDLSLYKFFEEGVNHKITVAGENAPVIPGGFAIIAASSTQFRTDWPSFSGAVFGSSFSLKNTGELLEIRGEDLATEDSVTYDPQVGGAGDGRTLQRSGGQWIAGFPTPGAAPATGGGENNNGSPSPPATPPENSAGSEAPTGNQSGGLPMVPSFSARIDAENTATVGADTILSGGGFDKSGEPLERARYSWNFGDGATYEGQNVLHAYTHPGEYVAVLSVTSGNMSVAARKTITVLPARLAISHVRGGADGFIELANKDTREVNLSWWRLRAGERYFTLPKNTYILPGKTLIFSHTTTGLFEAWAGDATLLYPNGSVAVLSDLSEPREQIIPALPLETPLSYGIDEKGTQEEYAVPMPAQSGRKNELTNERGSDNETIIALTNENGSLSDNSPLLASVALSDSEKNRQGNLAQWFVAVAALVGVGITGVVFSKRERVTDVSPEAQAFEIVE